MSALLTWLQGVITPGGGEALRSQKRLWLALSFGIAIVYGVLALRQAFSGPYVVQDDARQHVFWALRFVDPELFPHDVIVEYFQSVAPAGYKAFYWLMAQAGLDPIFVSKLIPLVLGLITTGFCFGVSMRLLPVPAAGFIAAALLNQILWMTTALASGTPRAFVYPLFLAFLYYLARRSLIPCLAAIALQGLFYPQPVFISAGVLLLRLWDWTRWPPRLSKDRGDIRFCAAGLGVVLLVLLAYALKVSEFGPILTAAEARTMPEFQPGGRSQFFLDHPLKFWLTRPRSGLLGLLPLKMMVASLIWTGLLLPVLFRYRSRLPLMNRVTQEVRLLPQIVLASLGMFFAAHALLFRLHLPSRYTGYSLPIVLALASAVVLTVMLDALLRWAKQHASPPFPGRQLAALGVTVLVGSALIFHSVALRIGHFPFPRTRYKVGQEPALYEFFARQPKDILIASLAPEADYLPTFSQRSVLVAREYAIAYHVGYYRQMRQRITDLIRAQYTPDVDAVRQFIRQYGVDFWLLDRAAFTPEYVASHSWIKHFQPATAEALASLTQGVVPALATLMTRCTILETTSLVVVEAGCVVKGSL